MLNFTKKMIVTGAEQRIKKDGNSYVLVHVLGNNGQTFSCIYKGDVIGANISALITITKSPLCKFLYKSSDELIHNTYK